MTTVNTNTLDAFGAKSRDGLEAAMESLSALASGWQAIAAECADYSRSSFEMSAKAFEKALAAKSPDTVYKAQTEFAKQAYDSYMSQTGKLGEMVFATTRDALAPIGKQVGNAA